MANHTVNVRIIMHLMKHRHSSEEHVFPREVTQLGIAQALGIGRTHAGNELRKLEEEGRVEVKTAYVTMEDRRMNVYMLTPVGRSIGRQFLEISRDEMLPASKKFNGPQDAYTDRDIARRLSGETSPSPREPPGPSPPQR